MLEGAISITFGFFEPQFLLYKPLVSAREFQDAYNIVYESMILCAFTCKKTMEILCFMICVSSGTASVDDIKDLVRTLNGILTPIQLAIKSRLCEDTNAEFWALINLTETEASK